MDVLIVDAEKKMNTELILGSGASACKDSSGLLAVCRSAMLNGIRRFDTAPSYRTEETLSLAVSTCASELKIGREEYFIQTKIDPIQMYNGNIEEYFESKLRGMRLDYVDSLLIHWPVRGYLVQTWESMLRIKERGLAKKTGICNLRVRHLEELLALGIEPEIVQIERHPLNTFSEEARFCHEHGVDLQDYSPLCKMHPVLRDNEKIAAIAALHCRSIGQVILRWHFDTGASAVFTSTKPVRVSEYAQIKDFSLSEEEINVISSLNCNHKLYLESLICPGF